MRPGAFGGGGNLSEVDQLSRSKRRIGGVAVVAGVAALRSGGANPQPRKKNVDPAIRAMYSSVDEKPYHVPTVNLAKIDPQFYRQEVPTPDTIKQPAGTIVVDPKDRFLYLVEADGQSMRYGIGVGREGFAWSGTAVVHGEQEWPKWFSPPAT